MKAPGKGTFLWTSQDIHRASQFFRGRDARDVLREQSENPVDEQDTVIVGERLPHTAEGEFEADTNFLKEAKNG